jgi:phage FluMu protein Com
MTTEGPRPIRCQSCGKLICEADGTVLFRSPRCKRRNIDHTTAST